MLNVGSPSGRRTTRLFSNSRTCKHTTVHPSGKLYCVPVFWVHIKSRKNYSLTIICKLLWMLCPGHAGVKGNEMTKQRNWWAKRPSHKACILEDIECWGAWDTTCWHKARDITPTIAWRREAQRERKCTTIFHQWMRKGCRQSDQHENCFKGNTGEISEIQGGAHVGFPEHVDYNLEVKWIALIMQPTWQCETKANQSYKVTFFFFFKEKVNDCWRGWHKFKL